MTPEPTAWRVVNKNGALKKLFSAQEDAAEFASQCDDQDPVKMVSPHRVEPLYAAPDDYPGYRTVAETVEACALLLARPRCREWTPGECAWQLRDYLKSGRLFLEGRVDG